MENQMQTPAPAGNDGGKMNPWIAILVVIVLIVIGYLLFKNFGGQNPNGDDSTGGDEVQFQGQIDRADEGQVISGFPSELLLEDGVEYSDSYAISGSNLNTPVVNYDSKLSMSENVEIFGRFLDQNGWDVEYEANSSDNPTFFYATKDNSNVNITFEKDTEGVVNVNIAYTTNQ